MWRNGTVRPWPGPHRILVLGGGLPGYFEASEQEKREVFLPRFRALLAEWEELGARVVASFCDDVLSGRPGRRRPRGRGT